MVQESNTPKKTVEERLQSFLLPIFTAATVGCFTFLWNMNNSVVRLQEMNVESLKAREDLNIRTNSMQLDIRDLRERLIRIETKIQK